MITLHQISLTYRNGLGQTITALDKINLEIQQGEFVVVVGANGSGKSSLLNMIAGTVKATDGTISFEDREVQRLSDYRRSALVARIFQDPLQGTAADLSILENFRLAAIRSKGKRFLIGTGKRFRNIIQDRISELGMGLEHKLNMQVGNLSGGQRQAITLLMATMDKANILLLDEPTAALDPGSSARLMELARQLIRERGLTALLVTHQLREALQYGTRLIQMEEGKIKQDLPEAEKKKLSTEVLAGWFM